MDNKIGLEEHFAIPETMRDSLGFAGPSLMTDLGPRLTDLHDQRLGLMDQYGIEIMILSLDAPAIQRIGEAQQAIEIARRGNCHDSSGSNCDCSLPCPTDGLRTGGAT